MRRFTFIILFALLAVILAACTDDAPSDTRGCIAEEGQAADAIYDRDEGCRNGNIMHAEGESEGTHGEDAEGESEGDHGEEGEDAESEDADHEEDEAAEGEEDHEEAGEEDGEAEADE
jgi:hypothetical protein